MTTSTYIFSGSSQGSGTTITYFGPNSLWEGDSPRINSTLTFLKKEAAAASEATEDLTPSLILRCKRYSEQSWRHIGFVLLVSLKKANTLAESKDSQYAFVRPIKKK